jgi:alcohol dehydrogenase YqhD (iron-dependent ADH family)
MDYYLQNYFIYKNIPYLCTKEKIFQKYAHKMIKDFNFFAPTRIVFGKNAEMQIGDLVAQQNGHKVLVHYGGGSAERSGLLDVVREQLKSHGIPFVELGGVVPNPLLSKVQEGISLCRREQVDFILAVGGGSVIDSAKAIGYGSLYDGDVWDFWAGKAVPEACLPIGVVLTIPAAGSEMSSSCVITKDDGLLKRGINSDLCRCRFAVMNPERTYTLPPYQTAAGATDIMMHTMERYFSKYEDMTLTDAIAEALLRTVKDAALVVMEHPEDYRNRAQIMWAGSLAHNDLTECGTEKDFATHRLEHELSALFGVTHGAGLAALWPSWARYVKDKHLSRFVQFAVNVMGVENDFAHPDETAEKGICAIEDFYRKIGMPTNIHELLGREITDDEIEVLVDKCSRGNTITIGAFEVLGADEMRAIYRLAK